MSSSRIIANTLYLCTLWLNTNILDDYCNTKKRAYVTQRTEELFEGKYFFFLSLPIFLLLLRVEHYLFIASYDFPLHSVLLIKTLAIWILISKSHVTPFVIQDGFMQCPLMTRWVDREKLEKKQLCQ